MTANLDGETNLKTQSAPNETRGFTQPHLLNNLRAQVKIKPGIREKSVLNIFVLRVPGRVQSCIFRDSPLYVVFKIISNIAKSV